MSVYLQDVYLTVDRHDVLWKLMEQRSPEVNISHKKMPTWEEHVSFVNSHPYESWHFIVAEEGDDKLGAIYLSKQNEIGVFLFAEACGLGYGTEAICLLMMLHGPRRYLANINPRNTGSIKFFGKLGFRLCQLTYEFTTEDRLGETPSSPSSREETSASSAAAHNPAE